MTTDYQQSIIGLLTEVDPPLEPMESVEAYIAATHDTDSPLLRRHAFGVVLVFPSSLRKPVEVAPLPYIHEDTHAQRGNIWAVISIFEWLKKNHAQANEVEVHTSEDFIVKHLDASARDKTKKSNLRDLYDKYWVLRGGLPGPIFMKCSKDHPRRQRALDLATAKLRQVFPAVDPEDE